MAKKIMTASFTGGSGQLSAGAPQLGQLSSDAAAEDAERGGPQMGPRGRKQAKAMLASRQWARRRGRGASVPECVCVCMRMRVCVCVFWQCSEAREVNCMCVCVNIGR